MNIFYTKAVILCVKSQEFVTHIRSSVFQFNTEMPNKGVFLYTYIMNYGFYTSFRNIIAEYTIHHGKKSSLI